MHRAISLLGLVVMLGIAGLMSSRRKHIQWRIVGGGLLLQFVFAWLVLKTAPGVWFFDQVGGLFNRVLEFSKAGAGFVFGDLAKQAFAFSVLPTIIFFSSLMSVLYYLGVMQWVVKGLSRVMQFTLGTSGAETLSAAANIFVGQTEAPLLIKPYIGEMTRSEIMAVMVGGFATIAGGVMAAYVEFGVSATHLLTASVISAPAALLVAKIMEPETEVSATSGVAIREVPKVGANVFEAATLGASDGLHLALNVAAMLIAFTALVALLNFLVSGLTGYIGHQTGWFEKPVSLSELLGLAFSPLAWLMGVPSEDCRRAGELLGLRTVANEFMAYQQLGEWLKPNSGIQLQARTQMILTYALCGFANFASIGIQIGGIGGLVPERRPTIAQLGWRAMIGGMLACFMTACVAGILIE